MSDHSEDENFEVVDTESGQRYVFDFRDQSKTKHSNALLVFLPIYFTMTVVSLTIHVWVTIRGWSEDGLLWGLLYFFCFIYSELYWSYRAFQSDGMTFFVVISAVCGLWWIVLMLFRKHLPNWFSDEEIENAD